MPKEQVDERRPPKNTEECVSAFLSIVLSDPEPMPKQKYRQEQLKYEALGYYKAMQHLRDLLAQVEPENRRSSTDRKAAETALTLSKKTVEGQMLPTKGPGGMNMWLMG